MSCIRCDYSLGLECKEKSKGASGTIGADDKERQV